MEILILVVCILRQFLYIFKISVKQDGTGQFLLSPIPNPSLRLSVRVCESVNLVSVSRESGYWDGTPLLVFNRRGHTEGLKERHRSPGSRPDRVSPVNIHTRLIYQSLSLTSFYLPNTSCLFRFSEVLITPYEPLFLRFFIGRRESP